MNIDVMKARFAIKKIEKNTFAMIVKYGEKTFIACQGSLNYVKPKFMACVKNRQLLLPVIQRSLAS
jgi:hypothetical protein